MDGINQNLAGHLPLLVITPVTGRDKDRNLSIKIFPQKHDDNIIMQNAVSCFKQRAYFLWSLLQGKAKHPLGFPANCAAI